MDYLKKNWKMLSSALAVLIILIVFAVLVAGRSNDQKRAEEDIEQTVRKFNEMNKTGWKIKVRDDGRLENKEIADANKNAAIAYYEDIKNDLIKRFNCTPARLPSTSVMAQQALQKRLKALYERIAKSDMAWQCGFVGGRLHNLSVQNTPIAREDFPIIFRQLTIYERLTNIILASGISAVNHFSYPQWLKIDDNQEYTVTPIALSVEGSSANIQKLVNNLTNSTDMLLFIKCIEFSSPANDVAATMYTDAAIQRAQRLAQDQPDGGRPQDGFSDDAAPREQMPAPRRRRNRRQAPQEQDTPFSPSSQEGGKNDERYLVSEIPKRQDYLVFQANEKLRMNLSIDLIEYKQPENNLNP